MKIAKLIGLSALTALAACSNINSTSIKTVHLDECDSAANCYTAIVPADRPVDSYLVLIPGFGESADDVLAATELPVKVAETGIAVFIPTLQDGVESYSFSAESQTCLNRIVSDIRSRFDLTETPYFVGGFSMGGAAAVRFAELHTSDRPRAVFAIDSPLDYERFRYATERDVNVYRKGIADGDSIYVQLLADITPLVADSPYLLSDTTHAAIQPLKDTPVRYYIEPATQWWLDNRHTDVLGLNILDGTAFINDLRLLGNDKAELIVTSGKGYRNGGKTYHPHSWTIVDAANLIAWLQSHRAV